MIITYQCAAAKLTDSDYLDRLFHLVLNLRLPNPPFRRSEWRPHIRWPSRYAEPRNSTLGPEAWTRSAPRGRRNDRRHAAARLPEHTSDLGKHTEPESFVAAAVEFVEQNFLDFSPTIQPRWGTFDLRSLAWPDPAAVGSLCPQRSRMRQAVLPASQVLAGR